MTVHLSTNSNDDSHKNKPIFLKAIDCISTLSGWCSALMTLAAVVITCQMIVVRFILNGSTVWQTEVVIYLIIGATLIGLPFVQKLRGHVNVNLIPLALPLKARFILAVFTSVLTLLTVAIMFWYSYEYWHLAFTRGWTSDTVTAVPLWIPYTSMVLGFALLFLQIIADTVALFLEYEQPFGLEVK